MPDFPKKFTLDQSSTQSLVLIKPDSPYFTIVEHNQVFKEVSLTTEINIIGKSLTEIYTWNSKNEESALLIHDVLNEVIKKKETISLPAVSYDLTDEKGKIIKPCWWQAVYEPILDADNEVDFILCSIRDITLEMIEKQNEQ